MAHKNQETSINLHTLIHHDDVHNSIGNDEKNLTEMELNSVLEKEGNIHEIKKFSFQFSTEFCTQFGISFIVNLLIFISGTHVGWIGPTILKLSSNSSEIPLTSTEISWLTAMVPFGGGIGPIFGAILANKIGRKTTILLTTIPEIITWIVIAFAKNNFHLCLAQFIKGLISGSAMAAVPMYLGEISSPPFRGIIEMLFPLNYMSGILFEIMLVPYVSISLNAWIASIVPIILIVIFIWMPESPYYFLIKNQAENARKSLSVLKQSDNIDKQLECIRKAVQEEQNEVKTFSDILKIKNNRVSFILCLGIVSTQFLTGLNVIVQYTQILLEKSNSPIDPHTGGIIIAFLGLVFLILSFFLVDSWGRRPLMLLSTFGTMIPCFLIGIYFHLDYMYYEHIDSISFLPLFALILHELTIVLGIIPLPQIYLSEMLSTNIKGFATLFICCYASICHSILNKFYPNLCDAIGIHNVFYLLVLGSFLSGVGTYFYLPETKGKTLEDIQKLLKTY